MNNTTINTDKLKNAFESVIKTAHEQKILFSYVDENKISVKSTDYTETIEIYVSTFNVLKDFESFSIDGNKFIKILKSIKNKELILSSKSKFLTIKTTNNNFRIEKLSELHIVFEDEEKIGALRLNDNFLLGLDNCLHSISTNTPQLQMSGAFIQSSKGKLNIVSTDSKRLSVFYVGDCDLEFEFIIPKKATLNIRNLFTKDTEILFSENSISIVGNDIKYQCKLINAKFPNYEKIIPMEFNTSIRLNKDEIIESLKSVSVIEPLVNFSIENGFISIESKDNSASSFIKTDVEENFKIMFNSKHIIDFLSVIDDAQFKFNYNECNLPFVLEAGVAKEIIMPYIDQ